MIIEFEGGVNGKTIIDCEGGVNGNSALEYDGGVNGKTIEGCDGGVKGKTIACCDGGVNGKTIAGCDGGVNGNDITEGADLFETHTEFEFVFLEVDGGVVGFLGFLDTLFFSSFILFFLNSTRFKGGLKFLILPPNLS